ncbi:hypothetical protein [Streptomyces albireticuli]|uniref:hypothetical protein n=1 Tax=Streptomyces albireticuli TaxID=1940 RepID=UPI001E4D5EF7|nr:hypothetical protein [Streptomyces albireticuli]MCD9143927.1 hypothetical protein [Streptomyces albireticuli]MCD9161642.1 hypothetical protein [Streptomyces albireticuli]MCD9192044.1 hypothetical protein [Streptomyces albireticuli]
MTLGWGSDLPVDPVTSFAHDPLFGRVDVTLDSGAGLLDVSGPAIPHVLLRRAPGGHPGEHVPIGSRDATALTLTVDGAEAPLTLGRGRITRRSYAVTAKVGTDGRYRLVPSSDASSRLSRNGTRLGRLTAQRSGIVEPADWRRRAKIMPVDAALGYALAAAFGTGARAAPGMLLEAGLDLFP